MKIIKFLNENRIKSLVVQSSLSSLMNRGIGSAVIVLAQVGTILTFHVKVAHGWKLHKGQLLYFDGTLRYILTVKHNLL